jgi:hypothetical protein
MAKRNCETCGANVPKDRQFCGSCGTELPPVAPKKPVSKKAIGVVVGAIVGIAALVGAYLVFFPAPLTSKDLRIKLDVPVSKELWEGDKIEVSSTVTFFSERDTTYKLVLEGKNPSASDWVTLNEVEGEFPSIELSQTVDSLNGENSFRVLVYSVEDPKPLATTKPQSVDVKKAFLPEGCSEQELNERLGLTYDPMSLFQDKTPKSLSCSMAYPNSDVFGLYAIWEVKTPKQFASMKRAARGRSFSVNMGESAAYRVDHPNEGLGAWTDFVVNFHGIVLTTDDKSQISYLLNQIVVK